MYRERPSTVPEAVLWRRSVRDPRPARILPDGCMDLIWSGGSLLVAGPDTGPQLTSGEPGETFVGLRFAPGTGPAVLGVPAHELRDQRVLLAELWPAARVRRLTARVAAASEPGAALESMIEAAPADPVATMIAKWLESGEPVAATARAVGLSERQLHRRCLAAFGYGPKTLERILRMSRAVALARRGVPFATVAATAGYADQAHLSRDVRALAGVPLRNLTTSPRVPLGDAARGLLSRPVSSLCSLTT